MAYLHAPDSKIPNCFCSKLPNCGIGFCSGFRCRGMAAMVISHCSICYWIPNNQTAESENCFCSKLPNCGIGFCSGFRCRGMAAMVISHCSICYWIPNNQTAESDSVPDSANDQTAESGTLFGHVYGCVTTFQLLLINSAFADSGAGNYHTRALDSAMSKK